MPEAVDSNSIPMPEGQPDDFTAVLNLTGALAYTLIEMMITARLEKRAAEAAPADARVTIWPELFNHVERIVADVYADHGLDLPEPGHGRPTSQYYHKLLRKLEGSRDPFEAGMLLPWLEIEIREDASRLAAVGIKRDDTSLRDRLIAEQASVGISPADLSQAFSLKRAAIERIIARLNGENQEGRRTA
ncbi:hypothetical protein [Rhizobium sp. YS-1r]|uniref:hypothetical protein n=1 Tax=Rhizobium sp. YS-1r TaxID=1532558 RepID=UPI00050E4DF6|nr:hypothetical protein [Rhizobium sp. YS-1r]KGD95690.1 hypothetical protein JL39_19720 [Rhizobium sp. YS-1r]